MGAGADCSGRIGQLQDGIAVEAVLSGTQRAAEERSTGASGTQRAQRKGVLGPAARWLAGVEAAAGDACGWPAGEDEGDDDARGAGGGDPVGLHENEHSDKAADLWRDLLGAGCLHDGVCGCDGGANQQKSSQPDAKAFDARQSETGQPGYESQ